MAIIILLFLLPVIFPNLVFAHAFGQIYVLPLPLWLYLYGGAAALLISFVLIGWFVSNSGDNTKYPKLEVSKYFLVKLLTSNLIKKFLQIISVGVFLIALVAGFIGSQEPTTNALPLVFWVYWLLGVTYLSAILGNIWQLINPFRIIAVNLLELFGVKNKSQDYPQNWGFLLACLTYFVIIWLELLSGVGANPQDLSIFLIFYTLLTIWLTYLFGLDWFEFGDFFSVFFGLISRISPFEIKNDKVYLKPPVIGLINSETKRLSLLIFILFMLSSTAFDGFRATTVWTSFTVNYLQDLSNNSTILFQLVQVFLLLLSPIFFLLFYLLALLMIKLYIKTKYSLKELALKFIFSLVPIALAYNIAHYYTLLLIQGQSIISLISDPFNKGWNLFGTESYTVNVGVVNANFVWHSEVAVIILGHIAAVYLAHLEALKIFPSRKNAMLSQLPMLIVMIIYTMIGLWILSQPLSTGG